VRLGLVLPPGGEADLAGRAEAHGLFGALVGGPEPGQEMIAAAYAAATTEALRVVVRVPLHSEQPVTLAEELAVLDNVAGGRLVVLADTGELSAGRAGQDLAALRELWSGRPVQPPGAAAPVMLTPAPAQVEIPVWLDGPAAPELSASSGLPPLALRPADVRPHGLVRPARAALSGDLDADRALASTWRAAGATHLLLELPPGREPDAVLTLVSRHLAPEVGMVGFPRVISESAAPLPWPQTS